MPNGTHPPAATDGTDSLVSASEAVPGHGSDPLTRPDHGDGLVRDGSFDPPGEHREGFDVRPTDRFEKVHDLAGIHVSVVAYDDIHGAGAGSSAVVGGDSVVLDTSIASAPCADPSTTRDKSGGDEARPRVRNQNGVKERTWQGSRTLVSP